MTKRVDFSKFSSLKIGPVIDVLLIDEIVSLPKNTFLIGGANNILVTDNPPPLALLSKKFEYIKEEKDKLIIGGATKSGKIASYCKREDIGGFEYLSKLPGTLGGLVKMNAGMKDDEIFNNLVSIKTVDGVLEKKDIKYGYRFCDIDTIIYEVTFRKRSAYDDAKVALFSKMRKNQPSKPSAGSAFKNPKDDYAGRLIEAVGLKGYKKGGASFSEVHANFLVNSGGASCNDALFLINEAKKRVYEEFDIMLENEIVVV